MKISKTMQFLVLGLIPVGILLLIFSIRLVKKTFSGKVIVEIPYTMKSAEFILDKPGNYSIWHTGDFFRKAPLDKFRPEITDQSTGSEIRLYPCLFRPNANNGRSARMEIFRFSAPPGKYLLELKEGSSISGLEQNLIDRIPARMVDDDKYFIQVRESQPTLLTMLGIGLIAIGGCCAITGLVLGILSFTNS